MNKIRKCGEECSAGQASLRDPVWGVVRRCLADRPSAVVSMTGQSPRETCRHQCDRVAPGVAALLLPSGYLTENRRLRWMRIPGYVGGIPHSEWDFTMNPKSWS